MICRTAKIPPVWLIVLAGGLVLSLCAGTALAEDSGNSLVQPNRWPNALWTVGIFAALLAVLSKLAWKPMMKALADREQTVADTIAHAEERLAESNELLAEYRERLTAAENEAQMLIAKARKQAEASSDRIIADARAEATAMTGEAQKEIEQAKRDALNEIYQTTAALASDMAGKIIRREISPADHRRLVEQQLGKLGKKK